MLTNENAKNLWFHSAPPPPPTVPLSGNVTCDVAIIGGGFTGLSTALHLAEAGVDAAVFEAQEIGYGGSGRNVGLVNAGMWMRPDDIEATLGTTVGGRAHGRVLLRASGSGRTQVTTLWRDRASGTRAGWDTGTVAGARALAARQPVVGRLSVRLPSWSPKYSMSSTMLPSGSSKHTTPCTPMFGSGARTGAVAFRPRPTRSW